MKPKFWFIIAGVLGVVGLVVALVVVLSSSPREYVAKTFTPASAQLASSEGFNASAFDDDLRVYTSDRPPSEVSRMIVSEWRPVSQYADGSGIYLRYSDDAIVIKPRGSGSLILVMDDERAYRHYYAFIGGFWGWGSPHGSAFRGRGPGAGK